MNNTLRFEALDSLRGLAAIGVAVFHFVTSGQGYLAVDFFFVLSGFILTHSYLYREQKVNTFEFAGYRLARLYPLHIFTLFTMILAFVFVGDGIPNYGDGKLFTFMQHLTMTHNVGLNPAAVTYNYPAWSVSVEFWINIIFIIYITKKTKSSTLFFLSTGGIIMIYTQGGSLDTTHFNFLFSINSGLIRGFVSFFLGVLAYRLYVHLRENEAIKKHGSIMEIGVIMITLFVVFVRPSGTKGMDMFAPLAFMLLVTIFAFESGFVSRIISKLKHLGTISYSIYLNQNMILMIFLSYSGEYYSSAAKGFVFISILLAYSVLTYFFIEEPLRKKGKTLVIKLNKRIKT